MNQNEHDALVKISQTFRKWEDGVASADETCQRIVVIFEDHGIMQDFGEGE